MLIKSWFLRFWRWIVGLFVLGLVVLVILVLALNYWVIGATEGRMYEDLDSVPYFAVALVLGTSRSVDGVEENPFFSHRVEAAAALYHAGKVGHFILSGDNRSARYNEPKDMYEVLLSMGVPSSRMTLDYAGLRTLDSVVRSKRVFGQDTILIISQAFHNYRALFLASHKGLEAWAYNAKFPSIPRPKTRFREYLARCRAVWDLYVWGTEPRHLGEPVEIQRVNS